ncbi:MAG: hypothetical protein ISN29_08100 [Gammaproteobacteria bacterium AqS3]|nr:hypothetical protein [Gammaproteobacteria bacterium AqS3]
MKKCNECGMTALIEDCFEEEGICNNCRCVTGRYKLKETLKKHGASLPASSLNFDIRKPRTTIRWEKIQDRYPDAGRPSDPKDLDEKIENIIAKIDNDQKLKFSDIRIMAYHLSTHKGLKENLKIRRIFLTGLSRLPDKRKPRILAALMRSHVDHFDPKSEAIKETAQFISRNQDHLLKSRWEEFVRKLQSLTPSMDLFDCQSIHGNMGKAILSCAFDEIKFFFKDGYLPGTNLLSRAYDEAALAAARKIGEGDFSSAEKLIEAINKAADLSKPADLSARENIRSAVLENIRSAVLIGLLNPFYENSGLPSELQKSIMNLFEEERGIFENFRGDDGKWPHVNSAYGGSDVRSRALSVIKRWLSQIAVELFFEVIEKHVKEDRFEHQFEKRKKLWKDYIAKGHIYDVWVVFGRNPGLTASDMKKDSDQYQSEWGSLKNYGSGNNQSILLMKVKGHTLVEWSHNGAFGLWRPGNSHAQKLYQEIYDPKKLRSTRHSDWRKPHIGNNWVPEVKNKIDSIINADGEGGND